MTEQELVALTLVGFAVGFLVLKLTGWRRRSPPASPVVASSRLTRGLEKAERARASDAPRNPSGKDRD